MSDFLHNLRNGNMNNRYDRPRKNYENPQYRNENRNNRDKRNNYQRKPHTADQLAGIKKLMEEIGETQKELVAAARTRIEVESRMADALEGILAHLGPTPAAPRQATHESQAAAPPAPAEAQADPAEAQADPAETQTDPAETQTDPAAAPSALMGAPAVQTATPAQEEATPVEPNDPLKNTLAIIQEMRAQGATYEKIARHLEATGAPTASGRGKWRGQAVSKLLAST